MTLSINQLKHISSLNIKKYRDQHAEYIVEGNTIVNHILYSDVEIKMIFALPQWIQTNQIILDKKNITYIEINELDLKKISQLTTPNQVIAIIKKTTPVLIFSEIENNLILLLDELNNPGNFGTIIRIADWFGIKHIICTTNCVDAYNPKTLQATMGSIINVKIYYIDVVPLLTELENKIPIYGALLDGDSIYTETLSNKGIIIIGNEANGISETIKKFITKKIKIPSFTSSKLGAESLNAAIATGIILSEFKRI